MYFGTDAFDTDKFQCSSLYQKEGYPILYLVKSLFCVWGKQIRVMVNFVRDHNKFQIL